MTNHMYPYYTHSGSLSGDELIDIVGEKFTKRLIHETKGLLTLSWKKPQLKHT